MQREHANVGRQVFSGQTRGCQLPTANLNNPSPAPYARVASPPFMNSKSVPALALAIACALPSFASAQDKPAPTAPVAAPAEKLPAEILAVVDDEKITNVQVEAEMKKMLAARGMPVDAIPPEQRVMVTRMVVDNMVSERLLTRAAKDTVVPDADTHFPAWDRRAFREMSRASHTEGGLAFDFVHYERAPS